MKQLGVYILIFAFLSTNTVLGELLKTPFLGKHFIAHQQRDPSISVLRFLSMHYWGNDIKDKDGKEDMQLPFKRILTHSHHVLFQPPLKTFQHVKNLFVLIPALVYRDQFIQDLSLDQLYRPPQA